MTDTAYAEFIERYRQLRLGTMDVAFVLLWRDKLDHFTPQTLLDAAVNLSADPRAGFPLNDLPLLIEHAKAIVAESQPLWQNPFAGKEPPIQSTRWNQFMLEKGIITKAELNRREKARGKS